MEKIKKILNNESKILFGGILIVSFILMLLLNINAPYSADDYSYKFIYSTFDLVENVWDIVVSQVEHYFTWGGRSVVHFIVQLFLMAPKMIFNIANSVVFVITILLMYLNVTGKFKINNLLLMIMTLLYVIAQPILWETNIWLTGAINYMWGFSFILAFLLPFRMHLAGEKIKFLNTPFGMVIITILGILAGWTNENTGAAAAAVVFVILGLCKIYYKKLPLWTILGFIGCLLGFVVMVIAPGNFVRSEIVNDEASIITKFFDISYQALDILAVPMILALGLYIVYQMSIKEKIKFNMHLIYAFGAFAATYAMVLSPSFPLRSWYGIVTFAVITVGIIFNHINYKIKFFNISCITILIAVLVLVGYNYTVYYKELSNINTLIEARDAEILRQKEEGIQDVIIYGNRIGIEGRVFVPYEDIVEDNEHWINVMLSAVFEVNSITLVRE